MHLCMIFRPQCIFSYHLIPTVRLIHVRTYVNIRSGTKPLGTFRAREYVVPSPPWWLPAPMPNKSRKWEFVTGSCILSLSRGFYISLSEVTKLNWGNFHLTLSVLLEKSGKWRSAKWALLKMSTTSGKVSGADVIKSYTRCRKYLENRTFAMIFPLWPWSCAACLSKEAL